jgi:RNA-directed DNA polymerase
VAVSFDSIDHQLLMKAVRHHVDCRWVLLYIERWLTAPVQLEDGVMERRMHGSPQGAVVSPVLANLFLHYVFDVWMRRNHPHIPFERYADDVVCHCRTLQQAQALKNALEVRFTECRLTLHPEKTKIVFCKDTKRSGNYPVHSFDFLGYTFRPRLVRGPYQHFCGFTPAISNKAAKVIRTEIRSWRLHRKTDKDVMDLSNMFNPIIQGWVNYYGRFTKSWLTRALRTLDHYIVRWFLGKYKSLRGHKVRAWEVLQRTARSNPALFAHWRLSKRGTWTTRAV